VDIQDYYIDKNKQKIGIAALTMHFYGINRQTLYGNHSAIIDARLTMLCEMRKNRSLLCNPGEITFSCPIFDEEREVSNTNKLNKSQMNWEKCTCGFKKQKKQKKNMRLTT